MAGRGTSGSDPIYSSAKAGVNRFSKALTSQLRDEHIRVSLVEPGTVDTPMQSEEERGADWMLQAEDIADTVLHAVTRPRHISVHNISIIPSRSSEDE